MGYRTPNIDRIADEGMPQPVDTGTSHLRSAASSARDEQAADRPQRPIRVEGMNDLETR